MEKIKKGSRPPKTRSGENKDTVEKTPVVENKDVAEETPVVENKDVAEETPVVEGEDVSTDEKVASNAEPEVDTEDKVKEPKITLAVGDTLDVLKKDPNNPEIQDGEELLDAPEDIYAETYDVVVKIIKGSKKPQDKVSEILSYLEDAGHVEFALSVKQLVEYSKTMEDSHDLNMSPGVAAQSNLITIIRRGTGHPTLFKVTIEVLMFFMRNFNGSNKDKDLPTGFKKEGIFRFIDELKLNEKISEDYNKFLYFISSMSVVADRKDFVASINPGQLTKWTALLKVENIEYLEDLIENA